MKLNNRVLTITDGAPNTTPIYKNGTAELTTPNNKIRRNLLICFICTPQ